MNTAIASAPTVSSATDNDGAHVAELLLAVAANPNDPGPLTSLGAVFARGGRLTEARAMFGRALSVAPENLGALWGLSDIEQVLGNPAAALAAQRRAIAIAPVIGVTSTFSRGETQTKPVSVLMLCVPGTFAANTPLEYIADGSAIELHKWYLDGVDRAVELPPYDVVFTAIGHDPNYHEVFAQAQRFVDSQSRPIINEPRFVQELGREALSQRFAQSTRVAVAPVERLSREALAQRPIERRTLVRPIDSQAGDRLALIRNETERDNYVQSTDGVAEFYGMPFVDYRSADGYYRKYRIVFIDGVAYPVHLAISPRWMVHYYNAPMADHKWMRAEEEAFLRDPASVFAGEQGEALREMSDALPFGYFAIDCGFAPDGRVMLFEADTAMLVHLQDSETLFPYKRAYMERIVDAVTTLFTRRAQPDPSRNVPVSARDSDLELDEPLVYSGIGGFMPDATLSPRP